MARMLAVVLLSGPIGSGKSVLSEHLLQWYHGACISTSSLLSKSVGHELDRARLQALSLDSVFQAEEWLTDAVADLVEASKATEIIVVDAVRTFDQVTALRKWAAGRCQVVHVHLTAEDHELEARYRMRERSGDARVSWSSAMVAAGEAQSRSLEAIADLVVDTTRCAPAEVAVRVGARLLRGSLRASPTVDVLLGGQWGSEGKGNLAFFLAPEYDLLVRVGAPNAGHKVHGRDGVVYTHRQLPSGTRATTSPLLIGPGAVLDVGILLREIVDCKVSPDRLTVDPNALIIEADDILEERSMKQAIGSAGTGGGAALARRIMRRGSPTGVRTAKDVPELAPYVRCAADVLERGYANGAAILVEGTQGTGLSILHGTYPHVTSRDTTVGTLLSEVGIPPQRLRRVVVAFRAYPIRVGGASGPMGQEIGWSEIARRASLRADDLRAAELGSVSRKERRVAEFSWAQLVSQSA